MSTTTIKTYIKSSNIDYLTHFGRAWIGFNTWYNKYGTGTNEFSVIRSAANSSSMKQEFNNGLKNLEKIDPFVAKEVDILRVCQCNNHTSYRDVTGFKFRLECANRNEYTKFMYHCSKIRSIRSSFKGILFFQSPGLTDNIFKKIYLKYSHHMASPVQMANPYNAKDITDELEKIGIKHYGELLIHDLVIPNSSNSIYSIEDVFGKKYKQLCQTLNTVSSIRGAKNLNLELEYRAKGLSVFDRFLQILYNFRSSYFHGAINPSNENAQLAASYGLQVLHKLMRVV